MLFRVAQIVQQERENLWAKAPVLCKDLSLTLV